MANSEFWTDKEIYKAAKAEWTGILMQLWQAIGKPVDRDQLKVYTYQLRAVPMAILEEAVSTLLRKHKYNNVPTLGEIWQTITSKYGTHVPVADTKPWLYRFDEVRSNKV